MKKFKECVASLRKRIRDLRVADSDDVSIHIVSVEIALGLVEFSLNTSPHRAIERSEEKWFNAGRYVEMILGNSEWQDIIRYYYEMIDLVVRNNYFRE